MVSPSLGITCLQTSVLIVEIEHLKLLTIIYCAQLFKG